MVSVAHTREAVPTVNGQLQDRQYTLMTDADAEATQKPPCSLLDMIQLHLYCQQVALGLDAT